MELVRQFLEEILELKTLEVKCQKLKLQADISKLGKEGGEQPDLSEPERPCGERQLYSSVLVGGRVPVPAAAFVGFEEC